MTERRSLIAPTKEKPTDDSDAMNSLKFTQDAISFSIPHCPTKTATVQAALRLLKYTLCEFDSPLIDSDFKATAIDCYKDGVEKYRKEGYPVNAADIEIEQVSDPYRLLGILKVTGSGEGFFLPNNLIPAKDSSQESVLVCLAFSREMIDRVFPTDLVNG